ncbi:MAG TPA: hypothetical protein VHO03_05910 [Ignavibacteriales bacterium]|nr:hypothetical protein [Ignavibacteriales bacterium]
MTEKEVGELPISKFRNLLSQCFNITALSLGGEFDFQTEKDKQIELDFELDELIREGILE